MLDLSNAFLSYFRLLNKRPLSAPEESASAAPGDSHVPTDVDSTAAGESHGWVKRGMPVVGRR